jgi:hypothetical protein
LISYAIFFNKETGEDFKKEEIKACQDIDFAVCDVNFLTEILKPFFG